MWSDVSNNTHKKLYLVSNWIGDNVIKSLLQADIVGSIVHKLNTQTAGKFYFLFIVSTYELTQILN